MSNSTSISEEASVSSESRAHMLNSFRPLFTPIPPNHHHQQQPQPKAKKKRSQPGNPDPDAEVVALSPRTLMTTNRFVCEVCGKGFQRDQNLQLHRRGHNLPWKLRQRGGEGEAARRRRVYVCPEESCAHHHPSRALGDLTGIKKHFFRKHGEKRWRCERCEKRYAVHSDWKAHVKSCGTREYRCGCGTLFSRKDSFITHRAFCDALAEESARLTAAAAAADPLHHPLFLPFSPWDPLPSPNPSISPSPTPNPNPNLNPFGVKPDETLPSLLNPYLHPTTTTTSPHMSATALLQKASVMGPLPTSTAGSGGGYDVGFSGFDVGHLSTWQRSDRLTRDFLGVAGVAADEDLLSLTGLGRGLDLVTASPCDRGGDPTKPVARLGFPPVTGTWGDC